MTEPTYEGLTSYVSPEDERERVRRTLYRTDTSSSAQVIPSYRSAWSDADLVQYRSDGYLAMNGVFASDVVESAKAALTDLVKNRGCDDEILFQEEPFYAFGGTDERAQEAEHRIRTIRNYCHADERLGTVPSHPRLRPLIDGLIGTDHVRILETALLKPPFHGAEKPWHQDAAYFDYAPFDGIIGVWIALDEATVENGCMQVIPGTNTQGPVQHYHVRDCQIDDRRVAADRAVVVPLQPGGVLFFSALTHHGTPPNAVAARRRALQFHYVGKDCRKLTIREHAELFDDGGAYAGCRDWDLEANMSRAKLEL